MTIQNSDIVLPKMLTGRRKAFFFKLLAIGLIQAALTIMVAMLVRFVFDHWVTGSQNDFGSIALFIIAGLVICTSLAGLMRYAERLNAERLGQDFTYHVRLALYDQLVSIAPWTLQKRSRGGHLLRFIGDLTALRQWLSQGLSTLTVATVTALVSLVALAFINAVLAFTVAVILFTGAGIAMTFGQKLYDRVKISRNKRARIAANVNEKIASLPVVQVFNQIKRERNVLSKQSRSLKAAMIDRAEVMGRLRGVTEVTNGLATMAVLFVGAYEVSQGRTTPGMVVASMSILGMLLPSFRNLGRIYEYWHSYRVSVEHIDKFLQTPELIVDKHGAKQLKVTAGAVEFQNISLGELFNNLNGKIPGGAKVAIVGPNGVGKSTLLNMIGRLVEPDSGNIFIDDQDIKNCSLRSIRRVIGIVSPDLPLLRGTIERNLRYRKRSATVEELERVCKLCGVDKVISELPEGMNTRVVDGGINFSFGQRQRIALARALLGKPKILLLDEVDANLDYSSKRLFDQIINVYEGTVIMITHHFERTAKADFIWYVDNGRILESGPSSEILKANGPTAALFKANLQVVV